MVTIKSPRAWSLAIFVFALLLLAGTGYAIIGSRNGLTDYRSAFGLLGTIARVGAGALVVALIVLLYSLKNRQGTVYSAAASALLALLVGTMALNRAAPPPGPPINDITTDLDDPPTFNAVIPLRPQGSNAIEYGGPEVAAVQRRVHPEVHPIESRLSAAAAFDRALRVAESMGWDIVAADASTGIIEAVDTTTFFRFKDDVVIRVRPDGEGSRIDLRSRSRIGRSDLGKNAARIMAYEAAFANQR